MSSEPKKRVLIIEDDPEIRSSFTMIVDSSQKFTVVNGYSNCEDAIKHLHSDKPDIVLMDVELAGGMNGIKGTKIIKEKSPSSDIIMVTVYEDSEMVYEALKSGASGSWRRLEDAPPHHWRRARRRCRWPATPASRVWTGCPAARC